MRKKAIILGFVLIAPSIINVNLAFSRDAETLEKMAADEDLAQKLSKPIRTAVPRIRL